MTTQILSTAPPPLNYRALVLQSIQLELRDGIHLQPRSDKWMLTVNGQEVAVSLPRGSAANLFEMLRNGGCSLSDLVSLPQERDRKVTASTEAEKMWRYGWLVQKLTDDSIPIASLQNFGDLDLFPLLPSTTDRLNLSENAYIRRTGRNLVIESAARGATLQVSDTRLFNLPSMLLNAPTTQHLSENLELPILVTVVVIGWLRAMGAVELFENSRPMPAGWSFSDRLMHARSRRGRHTGGYGATFPLRNRIPEPPAIRPASSERTIRLAVPDLNAIKKRERSFTSVLEERRSVREHSNTPMTLDELSEFLYRVARVTTVTRNHLYEIAARPYPSGGALHELEFYALVNRCDNLPPGLYRYNGSRHSLEHVCGPGAETRQLLVEAKQTCLMRGDPHVLILIAARFLRVNWKYESIAYTLILKNVGVVYQTMYLVATAMGLGPCSLGGGNADGFCRAAQLDYWEESLVGEFMLGRPAQP